MIAAEEVIFRKQAEQVEKLVKPYWEQAIKERNEKNNQKITGWL